MKTFKDARSLGTVYFLIILTFAFMLVINIFAYFTVGGLNGHYAKLSNQAESLKSTMYQIGYLRRDIRVRQPEQKKIEVLWEHLNQAQASISQIAELEESAAGLPEEFQSFKKALNELYLKGENATAQQLKAYDSSFEAILNRLDALHSLINSQIEFKVFILNVAYGILLVNIICSFVFVIVILYRYGYRSRLFEKELRLQKKRLESIFESLESVLITVEKDGKIVYWNGNAVRYFRRAASSVSGRHLYSVLPSMKQFQVTIEAAHASGHSKEKRNVHLMFDVYNSERIVNLLFTPVYEKGGTVPSAIIIRLDDVTDDEKLDERLLRDEKIQIIRNIVKNLSNNFNNALGAVTGIVTMIRHTVGSSAAQSPDFEGSLEQMDNSVRRVLIMMQQLRSAANLNVILEQKIPVNLNNAVLQVMEICRANLTSDVPITLSMPEKPLFVRADAVLIQQILMSLCENAFDALNSVEHGMPEGEKELTITISGLPCLPEAVHRGHPEVPNGAYVLLHVQDNGPGFSEEAKKHLFQPFFTTKGDSSNGLGLLSVTHAVTVCNGFMDLNTNTNAGTSVSVYLPSCDPPAGIPIPVPNLQKSAAPAPTPAQAPSGAKTLLVVDNEAIILKTTRSILQKLGYQILTAANGKEALELYRKSGESIDAVLLDMSMPLMNGAEAYLEMKKINPQVKAVIMSGLMQNEQLDLDSLRQIGVKAFIQKPFDMETLAETIRKLF